MLHALPMLSVNDTRTGQTGRDPEMEAPMKKLPKTAIDA